MKLSPSASASLHAWRAPLLQRWNALAARERRLLLAGALVLGGYLLWALALAPALRTLRETPAQLDRVHTQLQRMRALADEAQQLRRVAPLAPTQAQAALQEAAQRLGERGRLQLQGERAVLQLKGISGEQLAAWLAEARSAARAQVVDAALSQSAPGLYDGSLTLGLAAAPAGGRR